MADRKAAEVHYLHGNPGNRPQGGKAKSLTGRPLPPADLEGEAFAEWSRIVSFLDKAGRIESIDHAALVVYCASWAAFNDARQALAKYGTLVEGRDGLLVKNPAAQIMKDSAAIMLNYGSKFGFTPRDRQNLGITSDPGEGDSFEKELAGL
ncbi:phage terminase small subunit P27 family [Asanoa sp. WMMD1127]|uniref:phage terminase small subunit P27 family n=1 Tax=Asanoa sp. WMMD1127 TaxID=3016107 RepID=UPI002415D2CA|nr:phage terminase small subunit P27 family [Asanoa sp. WMMD1127]MDG4826032.1 phage terminase small subunit P27 family [Asanoa sp. WMMD1127]